MSETLRTAGMVSKARARQYFVENKDTGPNMGSRSTNTSYDENTIKRCGSIYVSRATIEVYRLMAMKKKDDAPW